MNPSHITFEEAKALIAGAACILIDNLGYEVQADASPDTDLLALRHRTDENRMTIHFTRDDNMSVRVVGSSLFMQEEAGEEAQVCLTKLWNLEEELAGVTRFKLAETAAALMDGIHQVAEPLNKESGKDAWDEMYGVAQDEGNGFPQFWSWCAELATGAAPVMEGLWNSGEADFVESTRYACSRLHRYVVEQRPGHLGAVAVAQLWEEALRDLHQSEWNLEMAPMLEELNNASEGRDGYRLGVFKPDEVGNTITWDLYGGPPLVLKLLPDGRWRAGDDVRTDSPRPAIAFKLARDYFVREGGPPR